jgi:uncharacterized membrane protein
MGLVWPPLAWMMASVLSFLGVILFSYLAWLTYNAKPDDSENRLISFMLVCEGFGAALFMIPFGFPWTPASVESAQLIQNFQILFFAMLPFIYLAFTGIQPSRVSSFFGRDYVQKLLLGTGLLLGLYLMIAQWNEALICQWDDAAQKLGFGQSGAFVMIIFWILLINFYLIFSLFLAKRNPKIDDERKVRIRTYLRGYALRYLFILASMGYYLVYKSYFHSGGTLPLWFTGFIFVCYTLGNIVFGVMFSMGILQGQILGIEHLFKTNINRAAMGGLMVSAFFITEELMQNFLSEEYGFVGGLMVTVGMMGARTPIMKIIDKGTDSMVVDALEINDDAAKIYREQYLTVVHDGVITELERRMLKITAKALKLSEEQCKEIESEHSKNVIEEE